VLAGTDETIEHPLEREMVVFFLEMKIQGRLITDATRDEHQVFTVATDIDKIAVRFSDGYIVRQIRCCQRRAAHAIPVRNVEVCDR